MFCTEYRNIFSILSPLHNNPLNVILGYSKKFNTFFGGSKRVTKPNIKFIPKYHPWCCVGFAIFVSNVVTNFNYENFFVSI